MARITRLNTCNLRLDGYNYNVQILRRIFQPLNVPRLIVAAYQPNELAQNILKACIQAIQRYTIEPYELWIVDNNSPILNTYWLKDQTGINLVLNRTEPLPPEGRNWLTQWRRQRCQRTWASYANAIALEIGVRCIDPETCYVMTLHMDIMPCHPDWISFLRSKLNGEVKAAGVRLDKTRVSEGVLHVLCYLVDFQTFRKLGLDFLPQLPRYDVGDRVTIALRDSGYKVFACPNTLWEPHLLEKIEQSSPLRSLNVDRAFDDAGNVIFLHLGRGIRQAVGEYNGKTTPEEWIQFAKLYLLE